MKWLLRLIVASLLGSVPLMQNAAAAPSADGPLAVTQALYAKAFKNEGFDLEVLRGYPRWLSPQLYSLLYKEETKPVAKGDAPDLDFDPILGGQDTPKSYTVGPASIDGTKAKVAITETYDTEKVHLTVLLKQIDGAWKVDDINYGKDGDLRDMLTTK